MIKDIIIGFLLAIVILLVLVVHNAYADTTTILSPNGTVTICTTGQGIVLCV